MKCLYLFGRSLQMKHEELLKSGRYFKKINIDHSKIFDSESLIGGGTMPDKKPFVISIGTSKILMKILSKLLSLEIPLIPRISEDKIIIDIRSSFE